MSEAGGAGQAVGIRQMMMRRRSPIEIMVDRACGVPDDYEPLPVLLSCPDCGRQRRTERVEGDPEGTIEISVTCPECGHGDKECDIEYFGADGQRLYADWQTE